LYYYYHRWYDPTIGRFVSEDPLPGHLSDPQSLNAYVYVENVPTLLTDPAGAVSCQGENCDGLGAPINQPLSQEELNGITNPQKREFCIVNPLICRGLGYVNNDEPTPMGGDVTSPGGATSSSGGPGSDGSLGSGEPATITVTVSDSTPTIDTTPTTISDVSTPSITGRVAVIGEDMAGRVKPFADQYGYESMPPFPEGLSQEEKLSLNRAWINGRMDEGYTLIDLGPAPTYANYPYITSDFYAIEQVEIVARGYLRWLPVWGVFD